MAPRKQWGTTPWGGAFLQALESIDVGGGRLKRGKTIANTNKVLDFTVANGQATSRVQGSYAPFYNIRIGFPPLTTEQKAAVLDIIQANPIMLGAILNGELPLALLEMIENETSVQLLPQRWSDFMGDCSCPDYSNSTGYYNAAPRPAGCPCKHMAGTFYVICGEMDKDPFTIFKLRGLDLLQELAISDNKENSDAPYPLKVVLWPTTASEEEQESLDNVPMSDIRSCSAFVMSCLGPNPPFSRHVDFHTALKECYAFLANSKKMTKSSYALLDNVDIEGLEQLLHYSHVTMEVNQDDLTATIHIENDMFQDAGVVKDAFVGVPHKVVKPCSVALAKTTLLSLLPLLSVPPHGGSSFRLFWWAVRLARLLVTKGAIVPDILPMENGSWIGIWRPLATNVDVAAAIDALVTMHPTYDPCVFLSKTEKSPLSPQCAVEHLLTTLCTSLVHEAGFMQKERRVSPPKESRSFFRGEAFQVEHASERSMASAIHRYFSVFSLMSSDFELELQVTGKPPIDYRVTLQFDGEPLCDFLEKIKSEPKKRAAALKLLTQLVAPQLSDTVQALIHSPDAPLSGADLQKFLLGASSTMRALGVHTIVPKELSRVLKPRLVLAPKGGDIISASDGKSNAKSVLSKLALVQFEWRIAIGDDTLSPEEFRKLTQTQAKGVVHFKHNFVELDANEIDHMLTAATKDTAQPSSTDILHAALLSTDKGPSANVWLPPSAREIIQSGAADSNSLDPPQSLNAELRPYQLQGFRWMLGLIENGFGPVLADDMGLGKTVQTLAVLLQLQESDHFQDVGPALIVVPTALLYNWQREAKRFANSLRIRVYHGANRSLPAGCASPRNADSAQAKRSKTEPCATDIVLTTYGTVRTDTAKLKKVGWGAIVIDEAQQIKNVASAQCKAIKQLNAPIKLALSGTPVENKLSELWSIFDFVLPGFLGTLKQFKKNFSKPIEANNDEEALVNLRMLTGPFLLRRLKTDPEIGKELPEKLVTDHECSLQPEQAALYQTVVDEVAEELERKKEEEESGRSAMVLKMIGDLKMICNHPHNFSPNKYGPDASLSGKCELLSELIDPVLKSGEQILIFTQYVKMLSSLVDHIIPEKHNVKPLAYHGGMSVDARDAAVRRFQNGDVPIMVVSLKAGGVGLNLTAANHVVMFDLWWNPSVEQQAIDRCFRIGQTRNVFVHRFITHGTFEVKINEMIARKRELSDLSVAKGEHWLSDLSNDELIGLLKGNESDEE